MTGSMYAADGMADVRHVLELARQSPQESAAFLRALDDDTLREVEAAAARVSRAVWEVMAAREFRRLWDEAGAAQAGPDLLDEMLAAWDAQNPGPPPRPDGEPVPGVDVDVDGQADDAAPPWSGEHGEHGGYGERDGAVDDAAGEGEPRRVQGDIGRYFAPAADLTTAAARLDPAALDAGSLDAGSPGSPGSAGAAETTAVMSAAS